MKNEYLMLAQTYKQQHIGGWFVSEKLDGCRAYWDGGISRGLPAAKVPYANTVKDYRLKIQPVSTGLWSRAGKIVHAPDWWLDELPKMPLDGELYLGKHRFQELRTIVGKHVPKDWDEVEYRVFDSPSWYAFSRPRDIKIRNEYVFKIKGVPIFAAHRAEWENQLGLENKPFDIIQKYLHARCHGLCVPVQQTQLPFVDAKEAVDKILDDLVATGAEGVMLRKPSAVWVPERSHDLLKYKPWSDAEGTVTGFTSGRKTNTGSKYLGLIGALILDFNGKRLELSGLTDKERYFTEIGFTIWAEENPGVDVPSHFQGQHFRVGDVVTFKYRELSDDGIPKEARYYRERNADM